MPPGAWSWRAASPGADGERTADAHRIPTGADGRPVAAAAQGAPCDPCRLRVGERLVVPGIDLEAGPTGLALEWADRGMPRLRATVPGRFTVTGLRTAEDRPAAPITVEVAADGDASPLAPAVAVAVAREAVAAGRHPALPALDPPHSRAIAGLALQDALQLGDDPRIASAFRTLASIDPGAEVSLGDVARAAHALRTTGDPEGAIRAWRAGLDAAFAAEASGVSAVEGISGPLVAVQRVREAALRYPDGPATGEALYLLPAQLLALADGGDVPVGFTATDVRLTAAAWDREFLATYPEHPRAVPAGLRLARNLLSIGAPRPAAAWAARVRASNPDAALVDGLVYLEALSRSESGDGTVAERLLVRLLDAPFPGPDGVPAPSVHRDDAQLVLGRLYEADGQVERALAAYALASDRPEAQRARLALQTPGLEAPEVVRLGMGEPATLALQVTNLDQLRIRAYAVDLRTLFLRDGGLSAAHDVAVAGVSPAWSGERPVDVGVFPATRRITLPLQGPGAWLVQLEGHGIVRSVLVVRSALALAATDGAQGRRVAVRRSGVAAPAVEVRALVGGAITPAVTDVRGVAEVPSGAAVLAWDGPHWAFTDPDGPAQGQVGMQGGNPADERGLGPLLDQLDQSLGAQQAEDTERDRQTFEGAAETLRLDAL
ncbi:MAG: hypothetical protein R3F59_19470 [Myxococcota bacterium]